MSNDKQQNKLSTFVYWLKKIVRDVDKFNIILTESIVSSFQIK